MVSPSLDAPARPRSQTVQSIRIGAKAVASCCFSSAHTEDNQIAAAIAAKLMHAREPIKAVTDAENKGASSQVHADTTVHASTVQRWTERTTPTTMPRMTQAPSQGGRRTAATTSSYRSGNWLTNVKHSKAAAVRITLTDTPAATRAGLWG